MLDRIRKWLKPEPAKQEQRPPEPAAWLAVREGKRDGRRS